jgi:hypothetical protein
METAKNDIHKTKQDLGKAKESMRQVISLLRSATLFAIILAVVIFLILIGYSIGILL